MRLPTRWCISFHSNQSQIKWLVDGLLRQVNHLMEKEQASMNLYGSQCLRSALGQGHGVISQTRCLTKLIIFLLYFHIYIYIYIYIYVYLCLEKLKTCLFLRKS